MLDVLLGDEVNGAPAGPGGPRSRRWARGSSARLIDAQHCGQAALVDTDARAWAIESPRGVQDAPVSTGRALVRWLGPLSRPFDGTWLRPLT